MKLNILKNFIVFEGIDGAGTSTQCQLLSENIPGSVKTFEPTDSEIGKFIRKILNKKFEVNHYALSLLFASDRAEHLYGNNGIISNCKNKIVICDRYLFSSLAYQSIDVPFDQILKINSDFPLPQVIFFINTPLEECQKRIDLRGNEKEIFEKQSIQEKVIENYHKTFEFYRQLGLNIYELNGLKPINDLLKEETEILKKEKII
jgi:dTMP kinase